MEENNNTQQTTNNPVSLEKPEKPEQQAQQVTFGGQPMNQNMNSNPNPVTFGGQSMDSNMNPNPNPVTFGGQPMNQNQNPVNFGGQPMDSNMNPNSNPVTFGGQPINQNQNPINFGGQPMNQNQNMNQGYNSNPYYISNQYGGQPSNITQGMQYAQPKKSKAGLIIGITAALVIALVAVIGVVFAKSMFGGAQQQMVKGFANMTKEMLAYRSLLSDEVGFDEIQKLAKVKPMHTNVDLKVTISESGESASVGFDDILDIKNKKEQSEISVGTKGFSVDVGTVTIDDDVLYFASDFLSKGKAYSIDLTTLGKDFNDSVWADYSGWELPEDLSCDLFGDLDNDIETDAGIVEMFIKLNNEMSKAASYSKINSKKECVIGDETVACSGVSVTYDKDIFNEMVQDLKKDFLKSDYFKKILSKVYSADEVREVVEQLLDMELEDDYVINYYLDKKGRIVNISTPVDIKFKQADNEGIFSIDISFSGKERTLDTIDGGIWVSDGKDVIYIGILRQANVTKEMYSEDFSLMFKPSDGSDDITLNYKNDWNNDDNSFDMSISLDNGDDLLEFSANGEFKDIVKGKSYTLRVRNASIKENDEELASASCTVSVEPTDEEIEVPENAVDFLNMSESDIYIMFSELGLFH